MVEMKEEKTKDCIFCKIISWELNTDFIYTNEDFVVFKSIANEAPTHLLIVPKKHFITTEDMVNKDLGKMAYFFEIAKYIAEKFNLEWYKLHCNVWTKWWQEVPHVHMHLLSKSELVLE